MILFAEYDLLKPRIFCKIYFFQFLFKFDTVLYQFLKTGTLDKTLMGLDQLQRYLGFSLYLLSFFLYSPFKYKFKTNRSRGS